MVKAGMAEEVSEEIQHEAGLPSKCRLASPEILSYSWMKLVAILARVGSEQFILPKGDTERGAPTGMTTDIHLMVLPFMSGTDEAVMCAIIFKSEQGISEKPVSWKTDIGITYNNIEDKEKVIFGREFCELHQKKRSEKMNLYDAK